MDAALLRFLASIPLVDRIFIARTLCKRHKNKLGSYPNFLSPRTFNERIIHRLIFDRDPRLKIVNDKIAAKAFIAERIGDEYNVPVLGIWERAEDIAWDRLPEQFVLKSSHASGNFATVTTAAERDVEALTARARTWLSFDYFDVSAEWGYRGIPRRLLAEPLLLSPDGTGVTELRAFTFGGRAKLIRIAAGAKDTSERRECWFDIHGRRLAMGRRGKPFAAVLKDDDRKQVIHIAEKVARDFSFLRVDFYLAGQGLRVGELTPYPGGGRTLWTPPSLDALVGRLWEEDFDLAELPTHPETASELDHAGAP